MANDTASRESSPAVALFQKAHQKMVTLQRLDEQLAALLDQRKKLQEELRDVQSNINEEFERVMTVAAEAPIKLLQSITPEGQHNNNGRSRLNNHAEAAA